MRAIPAAMLMAILLGCESAGPDRQHYSDYLFWRNAALDVRPAMPETSAVSASVIPGEGIVLALSEGYGRSPRSTAHASHTTYIFTLPAEVQPGDDIALSAADGTFVFDAFSGWGYMAIDKTAESQVRLRIIDVDENHLTAEVFVDAATIMEFGPPGKEVRSGGRASIDDTFTFQRRAGKYELTSRPIPDDL